MNQKPPRLRRCMNCNTQYVNKRHGGEGDKYCSRECAFEGRKSPPFSKVYFPDCGCCGEIFVSRMGHVKYCSTRCQLHQGKTDQANREHGELKVMDCIECHTSFMQIRRGKPYCSDKCMRRYKRHGRCSRRRARRFGGTVESFNPFIVFETHDWKCACCKISTPSALRGTYDERAPELDHRQPLSLGGAHSIANTQLLCRRCNRLKGRMSWDRWCSIVSSEGFARIMTTVTLTRQLGEMIASDRVRFAARDYATQQTYLPGVAKLHAFSPATDVFVIYVHPQNEN
jgi:hypothetical protein